ncbi:ferrous iron transport protein B [bacterium]|nr:ferrous iron transport protein B [bacterium]
MTTKIALAGNPNVGKSTIFNNLTGSRQHVGNWPGKTVEKKEGRLKIGDEEITIVDLPGTYSLTAYSVEEIIARDFIINENPTAVVVVVDASNLERNLYLVAQVMELDVPVILSLNMTDLAVGRGLKIDSEQLSERLGGVPVIETVGNRGMGVDQLKKAIAQVSENPHQAAPRPKQKSALGVELAALEEKIKADPTLAEFKSYWLASKLLEDDEQVVSAVREKGAEGLVAAASAAQDRIFEETGEDAESLIADQRYEFINQITTDVIERPSEAVLTTSDKIDKVATHRIWGLPIFLLMMWLMFQITANVSAPYLDWVDVFINETVYGWGVGLMGAFGLEGSWLSSLITDGIIAGVGGVLVFVPVLIFLYLGLGLLEDSGYMARAAFVMDRVMRWMGLHGKSFLPMIVGFGCTVPAIYATRTLENEKDRKLTGFLATFMSCGARLPVYVVFGAAFFGAASGNLIFSMYMLGIVVALLVGFVLKRTVYKGQPPAPFVMELPPYRAPRLKDVFRQMWERTRGFVKKAGTTILFVSTAIWLLMAIPAGAGVGSFNDVAPEDSVFGVVSSVIAPVFSPAGFGTWEASGSLVTGFLAKEVVVGTMSQIYLPEADAAIEEEAAPTPFLEEVGGAVVGFGEAAVLTVQETLNIIPRTINLIPRVELPEFNFFGSVEEEEDTSTLEAALVESFTESAGSPEAGKVAAVAFNVFVLLYVPCMVAVAAMRQEFGSRLMWIQIGFTTTLAWVAAVLVFQVGRLFI